VGKTVIIIIIIDLYFKCNMASNIDLARSCVV
jgi:hypothetical protein